MSKIDRVSIRGIRSFSPDDKIQLEFGTPLTMIVGLNGTGKTVSYQQRRIK
jgi:DNA repair protein RAD50